MIILGINIDHANSSSCLIIDNQIVFASEEERYNRIKNSGGFPFLSIIKALEFADINLDKVDAIAVNKSLYANFSRKIIFAFLNFNLKNILTKLTKIRSNVSLEKKIKNIKKGNFKGKIYNIEHHLSHIASACYCSANEESIAVSIDGSGDFSTNAIGIYKNNDIEIKKRNYFPNSLGIFFQSLTQFIGFKHYGDEYKLMGLSAYGSNYFKEQMNNLINIDHNGNIKLNKKFFIFYKSLPFFIKKNGEIELNQLYDKVEFNKIFKNFEPISKNKILDIHKDLAFSIQKKYEEIFFKILNYSSNFFKTKNLDLAGGCIMNSLANGKITERTDFSNIYIQPAAYDAGGALGAALYLSKKLNNTNKFKLSNYLGPSYSSNFCLEEINKMKNNLINKNISFKKMINEEEIADKISNLIIEGKIVGIFQNRLEWGARALGNRSIICDPRNKMMKKILNEKIKRRESFRPFAPSILEEETNNWFEKDLQVPNMMQVYKILKHQRKKIPAVVHIDGTGRLQTVSKDENLIFYKIIEQFFKKTDVPIVINTSFNENEPIVTEPITALNTFIRTEMDALLLQDWLLVRN